MSKLRDATPLLSKPQRAVLYIRDVLALVALIVGFLTVLWLLAQVCP